MHGLAACMALDTTMNCEEEVVEVRETAGDLNVLHGIASFLVE